MRRSNRAKPGKFWEQVLGLVRNKYGGEEGEVVYANGAGRSEWPIR